MSWTSRLAPVLGFAVLLAPRLALGVGDQTPQEIKTQLREIFEDEAFTYCHDETAALFPLDKEYCELVDQRNDVCPALPKVCQNEMEPLRLENLPQGRLRFGRDGKDYGPPPKEGDKDYSDYSRDGSGTGKTGNGNGSGDGKSGDGKSGSGDGNGSGDGSGAGSGSGKGDSKSGAEKGEQEKGSKDSQKEKKAEDEKKPEDKPPPPEPKPIMVPGWLAVLARVFFYLIIALVIGAIGWFIYKNLVKGKESDDDAGPDEAPEAPGEQPQVPRGPIETDVDRLLARARAMAQAGKYEEAIDAAYAALLRRLEGDGLIDLHPSRTNGDYVRSIRNLPDLRQALRGIASDVESVQFGDTQASPTIFQSVYSRVLPLVGRTAGILLVLLAVTSTSSCDRATTFDDARELVSQDALAAGKKQIGGSAPSGLSVLVQLLERNDKTVSVRRPRAADDTGYPSEGTIVILPGTPVDQPTWAALRRWVDRDSGTLIVAGYRTDLASDGVTFTYTKDNSNVRASSDSALYVGRSMTLKLPHLGALTIPAPKVDPSRPYYVPPQRVQAVLKRDDGLVYAAQIDSDELKGGKVFAFADDRLFANIALTIGDNAAYLAEFFKYQGGSSVEIWDEPQGLRAGGGSGDGTIRPGEEPTASGGGAGGSDNPLDSLAKANLLPIILQLMALVVLYLLYRGTRFGKPRQPKEVSRRAYADHARALGMTYARADASRHATALFSVWALDRLRDRYLQSGRKGLTPLAESISARTGRPLGEVMTVLMEATGARDEVAPPSSYRSADMSAGHPGAAPQERRKFWVMEELDRYLDAVKGTTKRGRQSR